jgi:hypothetical protein
MAEILRTFNDRRFEIADLEGRLQSAICNLQSSI